MQIRTYREGDGEALARLMVAAFGDEVAYAREYFDAGQNPRLDPEQVHVVEEDGEARASVTVLPMEVLVDGKPAAMGGVAAVMVHPAYRRRRYAGDLMRVALGDMRDRGVNLSLLAPFAHAFYRSFGYELATEAVEYTLKPTDLPTSPEQSKLRAYREEDLPAMTALLEAASRGHQLCALRSGAHWRKILGRKDFETAVYEAEGEVGGYLIYKMSSLREGREPERRLEVQELVAATPEARRGLISFLAALDPDAFDVRHWTSREDPLHPYLQSSYVDAKIEPDQMLRLTDVGGALGHLNRSGGPLVLEVADDVVPENAGEFTVGGGEVARGAEAEDRVTLDVRQLAQLYAGYLPARQLARHGLLRASSPRAIDLLEELFPTGDPWLFVPDHF
ncbi:MAG TPA: GNAT family N-acetyltransferase [Rubrobacter sp.]|nr:GNAT family N-acetyltransferase [Rubrobacter sp.]